VVQARNHAPKNPWGHVFWACNLALRVWFWPLGHVYTHTPTSQSVSIFFDKNRLKIEESSKNIQNLPLCCWCAYSFGLARLGRDHRLGRVLGPHIHISLFIRIPNFPKATTIICLEKKMVWWVGGVLCL